MIWASSRNDSGDMVLGFSVFTATLVVPFHVPDHRQTDTASAERGSNCVRVHNTEGGRVSCTGKMGGGV